MNATEGMTNRTTDTSSQQPGRLIALTCLVLLAISATAWAQSPVDAEAPAFYVPDITKILPPITDPAGLSSALQILLVLTVLSLAPAIVVMMTCFTRIIVVLALLRQALATQQLPPNQVLIGLALFMTAREE